MDAHTDIVVRRPQDGLTVMIVHTPGPGNIVHVQVDVAVGDDYEVQAEQRETAHYLEHLVASMLRSRKYPRGEAKLASEQHGMYSNAFTSAVRTSHYMSGHGDLLGEIIDMQVGALADFHRYFDDIAAGPRFAMEQQAVVRELAGKVDEPDYRMYEALNATLFPAGHPRAVPQHTDLVNVQRIRPDTVRAFFTQYYVARNMLVTVAGPTGNAHCTLAGIMALLAPYQFPVGAADGSLARPSPGPWSARLPRSVVRHVSVPEGTTTRITLAWPAPLQQYEGTTAGRLRVAAVHALSDFLTGGFTSRLLKRLRVDEGLVYGISAGAALDERDPAYGMYTIETSVAADKVMTVLQDVYAELARITHDGPTAAELDKYRMRIRTSMERRALDQSPGSFVDDYANRVLFTGRLLHDRDTNAARFAQALAVTAADVQAVCQTTLAFLTSPVALLYGSPTPDPVLTADAVDAVRNEAAVAK